MFSHISIIVFVSLYVTLTHTNQNNLDATVTGDQTNGGIHLFEVHAPGGGMGIGLKVIALITVVALVWWIRQRYIKFRKSATTQLGQAAITYACHRCND